MSKRPFLKAILMTMLSLPVVAFADDIESPLAESTINYVKTGALCDVSTLGVSKGDKTLYAVWKPRTYNCPAGQYLNATSTSVECAVCPDNAYCAGFQGVYDGNESAHGLVVCPEGYVGNSEFAREVGACTKQFNCSDLNPYTAIEHATAETVYANIVTDCTSGDDSVCSLSCEITELKCEPGYKANEDNTVCEKNFVDCEAGTYLPEGKTECETCPEDKFCAGGRYNFRDVSDVEGKSNDQGVEICDEGLKAPKGSKSISDCGKLLRINGDALYLYADETGERKGENPRLVVRDKDGNLWYANTTPVSEGGPQKVSEGAKKELHIMVEGKEYTVHTTVSEKKQENQEEQEDQGN